MFKKQTIAVFVSLSILVGIFGLVSVATGYTGFTPITDPVIYVPTANQEITQYTFAACAGSQSSDSDCDGQTVVDDNVTMYWTYSEGATWKYGDNIGTNVFYSAAGKQVPAVTITYTAADHFMDGVSIDTNHGDGTDPSYTWDPNSRPSLYDDTDPYTTVEVNIVE